MITDFHSVHTTDTSQCSSVAGSSSEQFEVRRYSQRAAPNSLLEGNFEILVVTEEEEVDEPDFRDEPNAHNQLLLLEGGDDEEPRDLKMERYRLALVFASLFFLTWLIAVLVTLGVVLGNRSSRRSKQTTTTNISPPAELQPISPNIRTPSPAPAVHQECNLSFVVSNQRSIWEPQDVNVSGLAEGWSEFVDFLMPDSVLTSYVSDISGPVECPSELPRNGICHDVVATLLTPSMMGIPYRGCQKQVEHLQTHGEVVQTVLDPFLKERLVAHIPPPPELPDPILVDFSVKNTDSITSPTAVNASGLAAAWTLLVERVVGEESKAALVEGSANIAFVYPHSPCPGRGEEWTCHNVVGSLRVSDRNAGPAKAMAIFAIQDGIMDEILQEGKSPLKDSWALMPEYVTHEVSVPLKVRSRNYLYTLAQAKEALNRAWPVAVLKILQPFVAHDSQALYKRRRLVELEEGKRFSEAIDSIFQCSGGDKTCFQATGVFRIRLDSKEEEFGYLDKITSRAVQSVQNGVLDEVLNLLKIPLVDRSYDLNPDGSDSANSHAHNTTFLVGNLEGIVTPYGVRVALEEAWVQFKLSNLPLEALDIDILESNIVLVDCPPGSGEDMTCHQVTLPLKDIEEVQRMISTLDRSIEEGLLDKYFKQFDSPLFTLPLQSKTPTLPPNAPKAHPVNTTFMVSNLDSIEDPAIISEKGLAEAWRILVQNVLQTRRRMAERRQLVELQEDSAFISSIELIDCPIGSGEDMTCHKVVGVFSLLLNGDEETQMFGQLFEDAVLQAIQWGLLDKILQEMGSPLFTGIGEPPSTSEVTSGSATGSTTEAVSNNNLHLEFQYRFSDDGIPTNDPTEDQLRVLVCETQKWLALAFHKHTNNPMITVQAKNITYNTSKATLGFVADINTWDMSPLPDLPFLYSSLELPRSNFSDYYVEEHVHAASPWHADIEENSNYFHGVSSVDFSTYFGPPKEEFLIPEVTCEDGPLSKQLEMEFTFNFDVVPSKDPTNLQLSALACQIQAWMSQNYQDSMGNEAVLVSAKRISYNDNKLRFIADFHTWDLSPLGILPYYESSRVYDLSLDVVEKVAPLDGSDNYFVNISNVTYTADYGVTPPTDYDLEEAVCSSLALKGDFLYLNFAFDFFPNLIPEGEPSPEQLSALACETQRWLSKVLQQRSNNSAVIVEARSITYDYNQSTMGFVANMETWDNNAVPNKEQIISAIASINSDFDPFDFILHHVHLALPADGSKNYFRNVDAFTWVGEFGSVPSSDDSAVKEAACTARPYDEYFHMNFTYSFFPESIPPSGPTDSQLAGLVCRTQQWLTSGLQKCWANPLVVLKAKWIAYELTDIDNNLYTLSFTADIRTWDNSALRGQESVTECLGPHADDQYLDVTRYILEYLWFEEYFLTVSGAVHSGEFGPPRSDDFVLDEVTCEGLFW